MEAITLASKRLYLQHRNPAVLDRSRSRPLRRFIDQPSIEASAHKKTVFRQRIASTRRDHDDLFHIPRAVDSRERHEIVQIYQVAVSKQEEAAGLGALLRSNHSGNALCRGRNQRKKFAIGCHGWREGHRA